MPDEKLEASALDIFVAEFVVHATDPTQSRGFLDGMGSLLKSVDPESGLARAAKLVVLALIGKRSGRTSLVAKMEVLYGSLLREYYDALSMELEQVSIKSLYTAVFLGIYEVSFGIILSGGRRPDQSRWLSRMRILRCIIWLMSKESALFYQADMYSQMPELG